MTIDSCKRCNEIKTVAEQAYSMAIGMPDKYPDDGTVTIGNWIIKVRHEIEKVSSNDKIIDMYPIELNEVEGYKIIVKNK